MIESIFVIAIILMVVGFSFTIWEETKDRKIMQKLFFDGLQISNAVAEEKAAWDALIKIARAKDAENDCFKTRS